MTENALKPGRVGLLAILILAATAILLRAEQRLWWCVCGHWAPWAGDIWTQHNSQHLLDPYTFTHVLHGFLFCGALAFLAKRLAAAQRFLLAVALEAGWEIIENSEFVINRYREATAALGYQGDTIANSLGDIAACGAGFLLARWLGWWRSLLIFCATELVLLFWIKDSLILNILMLIFPVESIKVWQTAT